MGTAIQLCTTSLFNKASLTRLCTTSNICITDKRKPSPEENAQFYSEDNGYVMKNSRASIFQRDKPRRIIVADDTILLALLRILRYSNNEKAIKATQDYFDAVASEIEIAMSLTYATKMRTHNYGMVYNISAERDGNTIRHHRSLSFHETLAAAFADIGATYNCKYDDDGKPIGINRTSNIEVHDPSSKSHYEIQDHDPAELAELFVRTLQKYICAPVVQLDISEGIMDYEKAINIISQQAGALCSIAKDIYNHPENYPYLATKSPAILIGGYDFEMDTQNDPNSILTRYGLVQHIMTIELEKKRKELNDPIVDNTQFIIGNGSYSKFITGGI